jgi:hypothetical protein
MCWDSYLLLPVRGLSELTCLHFPQPLLLSAQPAATPTSMPISLGEAGDPFVGASSSVTPLNDPPAMTPPPHPRHFHPYHRSAWGDEDVKNEDWLISDLFSIIRILEKS